MICREYTGAGVIRISESMEQAFFWHFLGAGYPADISMVFCPVHGAWHAHGAYIYV